MTRRADSVDVVAAVRRVFRDGLLSGPDESSDTFLVKPRRQLDGAPDPTVLLAAELLFVNMAPLVPEQIGPAKKRQILGEVLSWAGRPVALPADLAPGLKNF